MLYCPVLDVDANKMNGGCSICDFLFRLHDHLSWDSQLRGAIDCHSCRNHHCCPCLFLCRSRQWSPLQWMLPEKALLLSMEAVPS